MNILLLQTGIFLEELPLKSELGDFISTKCSVTDLFDRRVWFEKEAQCLYAWNTGNGKCVLCGEEMEIEATPDMYKHLFKRHIKNFIKCMILSDALVDHVIQDDITYVKEEVKAVVSITNCMGFGRSVLTDRIMYMVKRKARDIVENRLDSKVFANVDILNSFIGKVENYLQEPIFPF